MNSSSRRTLAELFQEGMISSIVIPIIQRDYAQGRDTVAEIRSQFLESLRDTLLLPENSPKLPLDLDFIYGSIDRETNSFSPLDGQQRLTTLFLLHWYLACKEGRAETFRDLFNVDHASRFSYKIRPSSADFFNALSETSLNLSGLLTPDGEFDNSLSRTISDSPWFFLSWKLDPTIQSALRMLDAIHDLFGKLPTGLYDRLIRTSDPYITFQFLNLEDFGLSDELYIKMNARGMALTSFEAFKARLEQLIGELLPEESRVLNGRRISLRDYFSAKVDSEWSDLFWIFRDQDTNLFDRQFMHFIRAIALSAFPVNDPSKDSGEIDRVIDSLTGSTDDYSFYRFREDGCFTGEFVLTLTTILDGLHNGHTDVSLYLVDAAYYDERKTFISLLQRGPRSLSQWEWIQFAGYCVFFAKYSPTKGLQEFYEWMRVISNLALNTVYPHTDEIRRALVAVHEMAQKIQGIPVLKYVAEESNSIAGFNQQQVREEQLKAQLILKNQAWREPILRAEKHRYFCGQIEFILKFSGVMDRWLSLGNRCDWNDATDRELRTQFANYFTRAAAVFDEGGLRVFRDNLWERALLSMGDYLIAKGQNRSFLDNSDRDASWKRLLRGSDQGGRQSVSGEKRQYVKELLDQIDCTNVEKSLESTIDQQLRGGISDLWRQKTIECPAIISFCEKRQIRVSSHDQIYLLSKRQMNSNHAELCTYHLYSGHLRQMADKGELKPFDLLGYNTVNTDSSEPFIRINWSSANTWFEIRHLRGTYSLDFYQIHRAPISFVQFLKDHPSCHVAEGEERLQVLEKEGDLLKLIGDLVTSARRELSPDPN